jgi:hypothetical protein
MEGRVQHAFGLQQKDTVPDIILFPSFPTQDPGIALFEVLSLASDVRDNIEFSCPAASTLRYMESPG